MHTLRALCPLVLMKHRHGLRKLERPEMPHDQWSDSNRGWPRLEVLR